MDIREKAKVERLLQSFTIDQLRKFCREYNVMSMDIFPRSNYTKPEYIKMIINNLYSPVIFSMNSLCMQDVFDFADAYGITEATVVIPKESKKGGRDGGTTIINNTFHRDVSGFQMGIGNGITQNQSISNKKVLVQLKELKILINELKLEPYRRQILVQNAEFIEKEVASKNPNRELLSYVIDVSSKIAALASNGITFINGLMTLKTLLGL